MSERLTVHGLYLGDHINDADLTYAVALAAEATGQHVCGIALTCTGLVTLHADQTGDGSRYNAILNTLVGDIVRHRWPHIQQVWRAGRPIEYDCSDPNSVTSILDVLATFRLAGLRNRLGAIRIVFDPVECFIPQRAHDYCLLPPFLGVWSTRPTRVRFRARLPPALAGFTPRRLKKSLSRAVERLRPAARAVGRRSMREGLRRGRGGCHYIGEEKRAAKSEYTAWRALYDQCRELFREMQTVVFPAGTVRFRTLGAACEPPRRLRPALPP